MTMNNHFDAKMKQRIFEEEVKVPDSYFKRVRLALENLPEEGTTGNSKIKTRRFKYATAAAAGICLLLSGTAYATVNYVQQRMQSLDEDAKREIADFTQSYAADVDAYSRELTDGEREKMEALMQDYMSQGKFPEKELTVVAQKELADGDTVTFAAEESMFILPERTLTDEELLQIIDFWFKRDYSLMTGSEAVSESLADEDNETLTKAEERAKAVIQKIYEIDIDSLTVSAEDGGNGTYRIEISGSELGRYMALYQTETDRITEVWCVSDVADSGQISKTDEEAFAEQGKQIAEIIDQIDAEAAISEVYCDYTTTEDGMLARETISYLYILQNGECYVVKYSSAENIITDVLLVPYQDYQQTLDNNAAKMKERGIERTRISIELK